MTDDQKTDERVVLLGAQRLEGALWVPSSGPAMEQLRELLLRTGELPDAESFDQVRDSSARILAQCAPPKGEKARRTGLVVGCVQSGKTMSMTSVAALARDNGFQVVIVFAGVTKILRGQSRSRFGSQLQPDDAPRNLWRMLDSGDPKQLAKGTEDLGATLRDWKNSALPDDRKRSLFITVLKNHAHLKALSALLSQENLQGVPTLIIDDEADQAGLNTAARGATASTTHLWIDDVRRRIPHHTYLQYTATPQAPLLISLIDILSPEFAEVLEPGKNYTGGESFFGPGSTIAQLLPQDELFTPGSPPPEVPETLQKAMREFFVGTAVSIVQQRRSPWSMLVHPSTRQGDHDVYLRWAQSIQRQWADMLGSESSDPDRAEFIEDLRRAFADIFPDPTGYPTFDELLPQLRWLVGQAAVTAVNGNGDEIKWKNADAHILVGGQKLDRGFTVRGLTVTYMPRSAGDWNADSIQQRARFFGYKQSYLDRCRVYLHPDLLRAFRDYVDHERDIRRRLLDWRGRPLKEWKRAFFLEGALRPTRNNVLRDPFFKVKSEGWYEQQQPHDSAICAANRALAEQLLASQAFEATDTTKPHQATVVPIRELLEAFLVPYAVVSDHDVAWFMALRLWLEALRDSKLATEVLVVRMRSEGPRGRKREAKDGIVRLQQGRSSKNDPTAYAGDASIADPDRVTIQIHELYVTETGQPDIDRVVALAAHVPAKLRQVVVQPASAS